MEVGSVVLVFGMFGGYGYLCVCVWFLVVLVWECGMF